MKRKRSLLLIICYAFLATMAVYYGLIVKQSLFVTLVAFHLVVCIGIPIFHGLWEGRLKQNWRDAVRFDPLEGIYFGLASGVLLMLVVFAGIWLLVHSQLDGAWIKTKLIHWGLADYWVWLFALYMVVINSFLEELLWRGFVMQRLLYDMSRIKAILITSFFNAAYHLVFGVVLFGWKWGTIATALVFLVGLFWCWLKYRYRSIYATWISHLLADLGIMASLLLWIY